MKRIALLLFAVVMSTVMMALTLQASNESVNNSQTTPAAVPAADEWLNKRLVFKTNVYQGDEYEADIVIYEKKGRFYTAYFEFYAEGDENDDSRCGWLFAGTITGVVDSGNLILIIPDDGIENIGGCWGSPDDFMSGDFIRVEKEGNKYKGIPLGHGRNSIDATSVDITVSQKPKDFEIPNYETVSVTVSPGITSE